MYPMDQKLPRAVLLFALLSAQYSAHAQQAMVGEVFASDASSKGSVLLAGSGTQVASGAWLSAGASTATLRLVRGGNVRICPGTSVTVTTSKSGTEIMLSMNTGAVETNYMIDVGIDAIHTPDFRIQFFGPNTFHFAIGTDSRGNTCVRSLPGNKGAAFVSELMGECGLLIKETDSVLLKRGSVQGAERGVKEPCGCPVSAPVVLRAEATPPPKYEPLPLPKPAQEIHMQVEAPFVFRATDPDPEMARAVAKLTTAPNRKLNVLLDPVMLPPTKTALARAPENTDGTLNAKPRKNILRRFGSLFVRIFK
jgi:hypothetical protein